MNQSLKRFLVNLVGTMLILGMGLYIAWKALTVPEMAWSHSSDTCVQVSNYKGQPITNGCQKVKEGKIVATTYQVP